MSAGIQRAPLVFENNLSESALKNNTQLNPFKKGPIAFFCAEYGIDDSLPLYAGGLGILAVDFLIEASSQNVPTIALGMLYAKGFSTHPKSLKEGEIINPESSGFNLLKNNEGAILLVDVKIASRIVYAQVWTKEWGTVCMYLFDVNIKKNHEADRKITEHLYPDSFEKKIAQEMILGLASVKLLAMLDIFPSIYHLNEGHTSLAGLGLALEYLSHHRPEIKNLKEAMEIIRPFLVATKHTILTGAGIFFTRDDCRKYFSSYLSDYSVSSDEFFDLGIEDSDVSIFSTTRFLMRSVCRANAVSKLHSFVEKQTYPESNHIIAISNGVSERRWMKMEEGNNETSDEELWDIHLKNKRELLEYVDKEKNVCLHPDALTLVWARRITPYKQPTLLFRDVARLTRFLSNEKTPVNIIISGRAYAGDSNAIRLLEEILLYIKNIPLKNILYLPDYSISLSKKLVSGADVWLNTPLRGREASGTSSMKAGLNGVLQLSVADGWFEDIKNEKDIWFLSDKNTDLDFYGILEREVIPLFYERDGKGYPRRWIQKMKKIREIILENYTSKKMFKEYVHRLYFPKAY